MQEATDIEALQGSINALKEEIDTTVIRAADGMVRNIEAMDMERLSPEARDRLEAIARAILRKLGR